jgi:hypothetical protein
MQLVCEQVLVSEVLLPNRRLRRRSAKAMSQLMASIEKFGFINPIIIDPDGRLVAGEARLEAMRLLGRERIAAIRVGHLSPLEIKAYRIADNKLAEGGQWDPDALRDEVAHLLEHKFDLHTVGFDAAAIDAALSIPGMTTDGDDVVIQPIAVPFVVRGDLFRVGRHVIMCGDALNAPDCALLMAGVRAVFSINDVPFNVKVDGHVSKRKKGRTRPEFAMASGEMSEEEFFSFLVSALEMMAAHSEEGAIIEVFIDWRSIHLLILAAKANELDYLNLVTWVKHSAGLGSFLRSQHELIGVFRKPGAPHLNNIQLGANGRHRTNVWDYQGAAGFGRNRKDDLDRHPTPKNVGMIMDAILDCTRVGDVVSDFFGGGGTTMIAAERTGRIARLMEIDPGYCQASLERFWRTFGEEPVHIETGLSFSDLKKARASAESGNAAPSIRALPPPRKL